MVEGFCGFDGVGEWVGGRGVECVLVEDFGAEVGFAGGGGEGLDEGGLFVGLGEVDELESPEVDFDS